MAATFNLSSAKITSIPTLFSWSQTYAAGTVFAVISLKKPEEENGTSEVLAFLGKEILEDFENEYFPLVEKTLGSISLVLQNVIAKIPKEITFGISVASFIDNTLYVFAAGNTQIQVQRNGRLGAILTSESKEVITASGFIEDKDIVILKTNSFTDVISDETLNQALNAGNIDKTATELAPAVEEKQDPQLCALLISCTQKEDVVAAAAKPQEEELEEEKEQPEETHVENVEHTPQTSPLSETQEDELADLQPDEENLENVTIPQLNDLPITGLDDAEPKQRANTPTLFSSLLPALSQKMKFSNLPLGKAKKRALFLIAIILIVGVIVIVTTLKNKEDKKVHDLFLSIYPQAQKKYDEGTALAELNKNLARDDFAESEKILKDNIDKFPKDSSEEKQMNDLLSKVESQLSSASSETKINVTAEPSGKSILLDLSLSKKDVVSITQDDNKVYIASSTGITAVDKKTKAETTLLKKNWDKLSGFGVYIGNVYVLDRGKPTIYKFVSSDSSYERQDYLTSPVDLNKSISMTIDGSIWVLTVDGQVFKFTKGTAESYSLTGLDKPFVNPTRIVTSVDSDNYYVLDNGNSRVVVMSKDKGFVGQYESDLLKNAKELDIVEKDKKVYFTSGGKIYSFSL